ncbi:MAG TPA: L,D-transpeptidase family protein [Woeseiaceae bacterium]|nr:L,D-transpeptidase family protein [Woeseiaceae bacterium]
MEETGLTEAARISRFTGVLLSALACLMVPLQAISQADLQDRLRVRIEAAFLAGSMEVMDERVQARNTLQRVYTARGFAPMWVSAEGLTERGQHLADWLETEPQKHGLRPADYHLRSVSRLEDEDRAGALVDLELALSDAFAMLASHFLAGRLNPESLDPEWFASRRHRDLLPVIEKAATMRAPGDALAELLPNGEGYARLVQKLASLRDILARGGWPSVDPGPTLRQGDAGPRVLQVAERLRRSGYYEGAGAEAFGTDLAAAVKRFQAVHGLAADGVIGQATLRALNVSPQTRVEQVIVNLERWRWLPEDLGERYIIVNIAGFDLDVIEHGENRMSMRVVVGQPYRRTPVFSGTMTYLVLNPWWEVPRSIAVKDKLPLIKSDPAYLERQGYSLLTGWGADEQALDAAAIDWSGVTAASFRFRLRQKPGPQNALGRVKFMFPNPHSVYLHDTPSRELFAKDMRSFSSGCIRLEHPLELAELLLSSTEAWRRPDIDRALASGRETIVKLPRPIPVHLLYWTAWADEDTVHFRDDIYGRDERVLRELRKAPPGPDNGPA